MKLPYLKNVPKWKIFPAVETLGYFSPLGNYICLNQYKDEADFEKALSQPGLDRNRFSVFVHEYQHYIDHVSTLWGAKCIFKIFDSFDAVLNNDESKFYKHRDLILNFKRDYHLDYYTVTYNHIVGDYQNRWKFQITCGLRFNSDGRLNEDWPIPFISFASKKDEKISRVPISVASLLETTATYAEYSFLIHEVLKLDSPYKETQLQIISKKFESKLYHPQLTLYSAAVHLTSVYLEINDPIIAYKISSIFAKIALNIPSNLFKNLSFPNEIDQSEEWTKRANKMIANFDRGFAFYLLLKSYVLKYGPLKTDDVDVENILTASNLPNEAEMEKLIQEEITALDLEIMMSRNNFNRFIIDKVFYGTKFRESTGIGQKREPNDVEKHMRESAFLMFSETYFEYDDLDLNPIFLKATKQEVLSREEWFRLFTFCEKKIDDFNEVCGI
jgi:hypothetical protein